jgi:hypothetical protein
MRLKVIACEIAFREICHLAAISPHLLDLEFLDQGYHDIPKQGGGELQRRIDAVPPDKYDALLIGYGLCSNILEGLRAGPTPLIIPRAHDCITFFLGSRQRYQENFDSHPGTYYYTSGWLECAVRRGKDASFWGGASVPASMAAKVQAEFDQWVAKYGEEKARFLMTEMAKWAGGYTHGALIDFDFTKPLDLAAQVRGICEQRGWEFVEIAGRLDLLQRWLGGEWDAADFLQVPPGHQVRPTYDPSIITATPGAIS